MQCKVFSATTLVTLFVVNLVLLSGCQSHLNGEQATSSTVQHSSTVESQNNNDMNQYEALSIPCTAKKSPPIKDKSKIEKLLRKQGKVSDEMSEETISRLVNEYITKKNQAYKLCKK